jgi:hypothetical protein
MSVVLGEEHRAKAFKNRALRRIFGPKKDEIMGGWKKLCTEIHNMYFSPNIIRMIK